MIKKLTVKSAFSVLEELYDPPRSFLDWSTPLELLIATVLSAQCTDARVNIVTKKLFAQAKIPEEYLNISRSDLEDIVHSCGTYHSKAGYIHGICTLLLDCHDGKVPESMEELIVLPGVGRKTAAIVLWAAFGKIEGIAVDTHVARLSQRMGFSSSKTPQAIERDLMRQVPREQWGRINSLLISHGRAICTARNKACAKCAFHHSCPSSDVSS